MLLSRRVFHSEPYVPLADNTRRSAAVMQSVQRFVDDTKKQWYSDCLFNAVVVVILR